MIISKKLDFFAHPIAFERQCEANDIARRGKKQVVLCFFQAFTDNEMMRKIAKRKVEAKGETRKGATTRAQIMDAAIKLFSKSGFYAVSFQEIAAECGLSQAAIFHYFAHKSQLVEAIFEYIVLQNYGVVAELLKPEDSAKMCLERHFEGNLKWGMKYPEQAQVLILAYYLACVDSTFKSTYSELLVRARLRIKSYLLAAEREKLLKPINLDDTTELLHDALVGSFVNALASDLNSSKSANALFHRLTGRWNVLFSSIFINEDDS